MNGKWMKIGLVATVVALAGAVALSATAFAQSGTPPTGRGAGYGAGVRGAWGGPSDSLVAIAAEVIGIEPAELYAQLAEGKTIADVAAAEGVALDKIVEAAIAPRAEFLSQAVADGRLTQEQADTMLATMKTNLTAQLSAPHTPNARGMGAGTGFVDADGDGVCDTAGTRQPMGPRGRWGR